MVYPEHRHMDMFLIITVQGVFEFDSNPNVRPMTLAANTPAEISGLFDSIAYLKCKWISLTLKKLTIFLNTDSTSAASVLRMAQVAWGEPTWRKATQYYLEQNEYNSVTPAHFYAALQQAANEDIQDPWNAAEVFETWEFQPGTEGHL